MSYYYKILFLSFIIPFIFSFHSKIKFNNHFKVLMLSIPISAIPFIIWDIIFTHYKIWGFNKYFVSTYLINLPIEEYLFFIIIPFCCLYTYHVIDRYQISITKSINWTIIQKAFILILTITALINFSKTYTFVCFISCSIILLLNLKINNSINNHSFHTTFILILIPFLIVNGALTGLFYEQTVVWYNKNMILGFYILTIPIEDLIYSYQLQLLNLLIYKKLK